MPKEPPLIDHNPHERRPGVAIWWAAWMVVGLLWVAQFALDGLDSLKWDQVALGAGTGILLTIWAMEMSGNKVPSWMVPPRRSLHSDHTTPPQQ